MTTFGSDFIDSLVNMLDLVIGRKGAWLPNKLVYLTLTLISTVQNLAPDSSRKSLLCKFWPQI